MKNFIEPDYAIAVHICPLLNGDSCQGENCGCWVWGVNTDEMSSSVMDEAQVDCMFCYGTGKFKNIPCPRCNGNGKIKLKVSTGGCGIRNIP